MIPIPIFLPSNSSSGVDIIYPKWVEAIAYLGVAVATLGVLWMIIALILSIITDDRIDAMKKPHSYSMTLILGGLGILIIAAVLMLLTGQKITE